jgi:acyl phosphate:glycerol-3-phosphate acyltransferase
LIADFGVAILPLAGMIVAAFLAGSIPFGYLIGLIFFRTDLRASGSGNIGAMNALRTLGRGGAVAVLILDAGKGFIVTFPFAHTVPAVAALLGAAAVLGHCFSPWLHWRGGKGVATSFGVILAMSWPALIVVLVFWVLGAIVVTHYSSVGSMLANVASPFVLFFFTHDPAFAAYGAFAGAFIVWTHRENIARLRAGTEGPLRLFGPR